MMRQQKWTRWVITLLLLLTSLFGVAIPARAALTGTPQTIPAAQTSPAAIQTGQTIVDLNVRSGPGVNFARLVILPRTATVALLGRNQSGTWLYVALESTAGPVLTSVRGWVAAAYIQTATAIFALPIVDGTVIAPATTLPIPTPIVVSPPGQTTIPIASPTPTSAAIPTVIPTSTPVPTPSPTTSPTAGGMTITVDPTQVQANTAVHVLITDGPMAAAVGARLHQSNGNKQAALSSTTTDGKGLAALDFTIPGEWSDHIPITEHQLQLIITIPSQGITRVVPLQYQVQ